MFQSILYVEDEVVYVCFPECGAHATGGTRKDFKRYVAEKLLKCVLLLSRSRLCHYSVGGAWWHLCFYESF
jgi:hypothetical protein